MISFQLGSVQDLNHSALLITLLHSGTKIVSISISARWYPQNINKTRSFVNLSEHNEACCVEFSYLLFF